MINGLGNKQYEENNEFLAGSYSSRRFAQVAGMVTENQQGVSLMIALDATNEAINKAIEELMKYRDQG